MVGVWVAVTVAPVMAEPSAPERMIPVIPDETAWAKAAGPKAAARMAVATRRNFLRYDVCMV